MHIMIHSLQSKLALQSIIWKNLYFNAAWRTHIRGLYEVKVLIWERWKGGWKSCKASSWSFDFWLDAIKVEIIFHNCKLPSYQELYKMILDIIESEEKKSRSFTSFIRRVGATISLWRPITVFGSTLKITIAVVIVIAVSLVNLALVQIITARACPWVGIITWKRLCATLGFVRKVSTATICFTNQVK